ncbi:hypothetical protein Fmac_002992 [Flemingia macrophylla]|uniref:Enoyl reductase (ER) domain-containing protein n=1 Tax=Flemingia macrophylla TaxID=520843 RepID=A0ABD1NMX8_9FABA
MSNALAAPQNEQVAAFGWAARDASGLLSPFHFTRRPNGDNDITLHILYSGICHSDLHMVKNDFGMSKHEIVGKVTKVGSKVTKFNVGDIAGVGPVVGSCGSCSECNKGFYIYCPKMILTYGVHDHDGTITQGGHSDKIIVNQNFAVLIPKSLPLDSAAPLLCAGITVYSPMKSFGLAQPGLHLGIVGLGGLGHVAVKFAKAFDMHVTVISTSDSKKKEALGRLGADAFLVSQDQQKLQDAMGTMDAIIDTVSANHSIQPLIGLLKAHGKLILLGAPALPLEVLALPLLMGRKMIAGSAIGGMEEMQEMMDFAAKHNITADVEVIPMDYVNTAFERLQNNDVKYRFVFRVVLNPEHDSFDRTKVGNGKPERDSLDHTKVFRVVFNLSATHLIVLRLVNVNMSATRLITLRCFPYHSQPEYDSFDHTKAESRFLQNDSSDLETCRVKASIHNIQIQLKHGRAEGYLFLLSNKGTLHNLPHLSCQHRTILDVKTKTRHLEHHPARSLVEPRPSFHHPTLTCA